ncbi:GNAT family N-acetyltransferase [Arthrobacter sp. QXT-31]|uniref:GNAT family N-acetyltransferase n=1 Tax=Arthrobacter sp. QXT-31 TaxID=1357915 RepID=UPI000971B8DA|nr:GNAT family N-acetyltransferase [Arthrobacter sp. QXT-31]APX03086.1 GNAT family N-acetyltransferase [Arthrobacter sp. QXT-31]
MTTPSYRIEPLFLPASLDAAEAADFLEFSDLSDALALELWGNLDRATPRKARLEGWRDDEYGKLRLFFVRLDGRMVARSWIRFPQQENLQDAFLRVDVLQEFCGRGIGQALLRHVEALAAEDGRSTLQSFTEHAPGFDPNGPGILKPGTGTGGVPAAARGVRFAVAAGYTLEQVTRFSALDMPPSDGVLDALEREATGIAGDQYEILGWTDRCPDEYVEQMAVLMSKMSTDTPAGALHYDAEVWDAKRVRHVEDEWKRTGLESLVAVARDRASGELAAYSVLQHTGEKPWLAEQDDTLVAQAHRGHRLGMLVKVRNLRRLQEDHPEVERVLTFNAAENDHMLAINLALGFRPAGYDGEWQRRR